MAPGGEFDHSFEALLEHPDLAGLEARIDYFGATEVCTEATPFDKYYFEAARTPGGEDIHTRATEQARQDQARRFELLIGREPAARAVVEDLIENSVDLFDDETYYTLDEEEHFYLLVQRLPDPADLLGRMATWEEDFTPERCAEKRIGLLRGVPNLIHQSLIAQLDAGHRLRAYEGLLQELYGDRWEAYKRATSFDFVTWQAETAEFKDVAALRARDMLESDDWQ